MPDTKAELLYQDLRDQVIASPCGKKLNSLRRYMQKYEVSLSTVVRAVDKLRDQGLIDIVHGRGMFVTGNPVTRKKLHAVEILFFGSEYSINEHGYIRDLLHHLSVRLGEKNVSTRIRRFDNKVTLKTVTNALSRLELENVITLLLPNTEILEYLKSRQIPYVCISPDVPHKIFNSIYLNNARIMELIFAHLVANGHRQIAYLHILQEYYFSMDKNERYLGVLHECARHHLVPDISLFKFGGYTATATRKAFAELLDSGKPFTAVIGNDHTIVGIYQELAARNLRIGDDISVIGIDYLDINQCLIPELTTIKISREEIAAAAIQMLEAVSENLDYELPCISIEPELISGESVKTVRNK